MYRPEREAQYVVATEGSAHNIGQDAERLGAMEYHAKPLDPECPEDGDWLLTVLWDEDTGPTSSEEGESIHRWIDRHTRPRFLLGG